jgi:hypothetical protein
LITSKALEAQLRNLSILLDFGDGNPPGGAVIVDLTFLHESRNFGARARGSALHVFLPFEIIRSDTSQPPGTQPWPGDRGILLKKQVQIWCFGALTTEAQNLYSVSYKRRACSWATMAGDRCKQSDHLAMMLGGKNLSQNGQEMI